MELFKTLKVGVDLGELDLTGDSTLRSETMSVLISEQ